MRILIVGGGHVGLYAARRLARKIHRGEAEIIMVDPQPHMTYQPFLPEAAAGSISPRHAVVPLRRELRGKATVLAGTVSRVEHARKVAIVEPIIGPSREVAYDHIILVPGSISRTLPIPGLREEAVGFKTVGEAIYLRNKVLEQIDVAATTTDPATRRRALTFVFIGGGYAGIEAMAEMEDMATAALHYYPELKHSDMHWILVEATQRILPEVTRDLGAYAVEEMRKRNMDIRLSTRMESCEGGLVKLSDGDQYRADTIVWTAGVKAHPMLEHTDLPRDSRGRLRCTPTLQVTSGDQLGGSGVVEGAWSAGDCAAVPDMTAADPATTMCAPSAQHAVRQARTLADNIVAVIRGQVPTMYKHKYVGSVASLGLYKGVAWVYGVKVRGFPAWFMHRTYHLSRIPSVNRKIRVTLDWTQSLILRREVVSLGELHTPRGQFESAAEPFTKVPEPVNLDTRIRG